MLQVTLEKLEQHHH